MTTPTDTEPSVESFALAATTMKLLAEPSRLHIAWALLRGEHSVNDLARHIGANPPAVSQHLAKLRLARIVTTRRDGNRIFYLIDNAHVRNLVAEALSHTAHVLENLPDHD